MGAVALALGSAGSASAGVYDLLFMQSNYFGADSNYAPSVACPVGADVTQGTYWHLEVMDYSYGQLAQLPAVTDVHAAFGTTGVVTSSLPDEDGHGAWVLSSLGDSIGEGTYVTLESPAPKLSWLQVSGVCQVGLATEPTTAPTVEPTSSASGEPTQEPTAAPTQSGEPSSTPSATDAPIVVISVPEPGDGVVPVTPSPSASTPAASSSSAAPTSSPTTQVLGVKYVSPTASASAAATTQVLGVRYVTGELPATGRDTRTPLAVGLALLLSGVALVRLPGRRQGRHHA